MGGCNCGGRRKTAPLGAKTKPAPAPTRDTARKAVSMKDAAKSTGRTQTFTLTTTDGRTQTFGSRLEAQAARARAGGGMIR